MRKSLLYSFTAVIFFVFAVCGAHASAQELSKEEKKQEHTQRRKVVNIMLSINDEDHTLISQISPAGATSEQVKNFEERVNEAGEYLKTEMHEKYKELGVLSRDNLSEYAETLAYLLLKENEIGWKCIYETLSAEVVEKLELHAFQQFGGVFGGAVAVENLAPLKLTSEQKEKIKKIVEKQSRERFEIYYTKNMDWMETNFMDDAAFEVTFKEIAEKFIFLARGQREIESLLTDEQKQLAEKLMADVPEELRFLSDYLKNHP